MSLVSFWDSPQWEAYTRAEGTYPRSNDGIGGNLIIALALADVLWRGISDGHRSDILFAERRLIVTDGPFAAYRDLNRRCGSVRPEETYRLQEDWWRQGDAVVLVAHEGEEVCAAAYFIVWRDWSYYASGPRCREHRHRGAAALLIWAAMRGRLFPQCRTLDMGPLCGPEASDKERRIADFKRRFGAVEKEKVRI